MYPTAAKMVAAVVLAATGYLTSDLIRPLMPEGTAFGWFNVVNTVIGFLSGWIVVGRRAGRGMSQAIGIGVTGVATLVFWGLFVQGFNEMLRLAMMRRYDGPMEALVNVLQIGMEWGLILLDPKVLAVLAIGAVVSGIASEIAARNWR